MKSTNILLLWVCLCGIFITTACDHRGVPTTGLREDAFQISRVACSICPEGHCCCVVDLSRPDTLPVFITVRPE